MWKFTPKSDTSAISAFLLITLTCRCVIGNCVLCWIFHSKIAFVFEKCTIRCQGGKIDTLSCRRHKDGCRIMEILAGFGMAVNGLTAAHRRGSQSGKSMQLQCNAGRHKVLYGVTSMFKEEATMSYCRSCLEHLWSSNGGWGFQLHLHLTFHPVNLRLLFCVLKPTLLHLRTAACSSQP